tara:strand:- start:375 stop:611 length:237 start_codon:yes stop_codon:yes gene_type:complete
MHVALKPNDFTPQLLHVLRFDLKELNPIKSKSNNKRGIKNKSNRMLPMKLTKKLIPKIGTTNNIINEYEIKFLLALRK